MWWRNLSGQRRQTAHRGQSLVEVTLFLPLLLMMFAGLVEFGFALNQYLNTLDAAREGARYSSDGDPLVRAFCGDDDNDDLFDDGGSPTADDGCGGVSDPAQVGSLRDDTVVWTVDPDGTSDPPNIGDPFCGTTDFYMQTACIALQTVSPVPLDPARDDVVISIFRVLSGTVVGRWPGCLPENPHDCPRDPPTYTETLGEWHLYGQGSQCGNGLDDDSDGTIDDGCLGNPAVGSPEMGCDPATVIYCHPSRVSTTAVEDKLDVAAPNTAVAAVEVFFSYNQILKLPWITPFVPDPLPMHTFTIVPLPAAEPTLTISGTVTEAGSPLPGVTIDFTDGGGNSVAIAITDNLGNYKKGGFNSGTYILTPTKPGSTCVFTPATRTVVLTIQDSPNNDFTAVCPTPTPTNTPTPTPTDTPTPTNTPADTPTPTITPTPVDPPVCTPLVDPASSTLVINNGIDQVTSDNLATAEIIVSLKTNCGIPVAAQPVTLSSSRGGIDTITPVAGVTNVAGQVTFSVKSATTSDYDFAVQDYLPSVFTAQTGIVTLAQTAPVKFVCVTGRGLPPQSLSDARYQFKNDTLTSRRLVSVFFIWPAAGPRVFTSMELNPDQIWPGTANTSPVLINSGWTGGNRVIGPSASKTLQLFFNFELASIPGGPYQYIVRPSWDDPANPSSVCTSVAVTVIQ